MSVSKKYYAPLQDMGEEPNNQDSPWKRATIILLSVGITALVIAAINNAGVNQTNFTQEIASLQKDLQDLRDKLNAISTAQDSSKTQVSSLQSSVNTLTSRINTPVNLYKGCIQNTSVCTMSREKKGYVGGCSTPPLAYVDSSVSSMITIIIIHDTTMISSPPQDTKYYTMGMRCEYELLSEGYEYIESATLKKYAGDEYACSCDATNIYTHLLDKIYITTHDSIVPSFSATCTLIITRCPRTVNLMN